MTAQRKPLPVDESDLDDVEDGAWGRDDTSARFFDRLREDGRAQARFEAVLAEIHEHQESNWSIVTIEEEIGDWLRGRPRWQQHVALMLRRHEVIDAALIEAIADALEADDDSTFTTLSDDKSGPGPKSDRRAVTLSRVHGVTGVNALGNEAELTFGSDGLTVIFGNNASGKSGFARLLKHVVGARAYEDVLPDVFADRQVDQSAIVDYVVGTEAKKLDHKWPGPTAPPLKRVHFYDRQCGHAYLTTDSEIDYRPSALDIFDGLVEVCDIVRSEFDRRLDELDKPGPSIGNYSLSGEASRFVAGLSFETTQEEIAEACSADPDIDVQIMTAVEDEVRLKGTDQTAEKKRLEAIAVLHDDLLCLSTRVTDLVADTATHELGRLMADANSKRHLARAASSADPGRDPVSGVGSDAWRALWRAAEYFSVTEAYVEHDFPHTGSDARCVLCQQELAAESVDRLNRFQSFMVNRSEAEAQAAEDEVRQRREDLATLRSDLLTARADCTALDTFHGEAVNQLATWAVSAADAAQVLHDWPERGGEAPATQMAPLPAWLTKETKTNVEQQAAGIDTESFEQHVSEAAARVTALQDKRTLADHKSNIIKEVDRLRKKEALSLARKKTDTTGITRRAGELTRKHVTSAVRDLFAKETNRLGMKRITLNDVGAVKGKLLHQPALRGAKRKERIDSVLSEGEQTALGMAGLFTEVELDSSKSALVLDDPVTSLDHERRSQVATRLVEFAAKRQVVVFTHDIALIGELVRRSGDASVSLTERYLESRGYSAGFVDDKFPWKAKDVASRLDDLDSRLSSIEKEADALAEDEYEQRVGDWAGRLSETWERAVSQEIVQQVVDQGTLEVRPKMVRVLAEITDADYQNFQKGYTECSTWARRHDKAPEVGFAAPRPEQLRTEFDRLHGWFKRVKRYKQ